MDGGAVPEVGGIEDGYVEGNVGVFGLEGGLGDGGVGVGSDSGLHGRKGT